jgi:hypothetical protein
MSSHALVSAPGSVFALIRVSRMALDGAHGRPEWR